MHDALLGAGQVKGSVQQSEWRQAMTRFLTKLAASTLLLFAPLTAFGQSVPNALSVEWQGQKPCERLYEDAQIHIARCTFPSGAMHVCHSHPSYISYVLSGGKAQIQDEKGTRQVELRTGSYADVPPVPWH